MLGGSVKRKAVGFYWTLPVPWVGFSGLSENIEEAAQQSRTIRYQMERVRSWAADEGYELVKEEVFLELAPDRGGEHVVPPLDKLAAFCRARDKEWRAGKRAREAAAKARAGELKAQGLSLPAIAEQLNASGVASPTGKAWSGDNLRKLLKSA